MNNKNIQYKILTRNSEGCLEYPVNNESYYE